MTGTPEDLQNRIRAYYEQMTTASYLPNWAGESLALHFGLSHADGETRSLADSLLAMNAFVADRARIGPGDRVLDAGCGVGGSSVWLARERGAHVVGITIEPGQVDLARRIADERGVSAHATFEVMDFAATSFPEASFDVVWNLESLCHAASARDYLEHVRWLLRHGGRFACADLFLGSSGDPAHARAMCEGWVLPALERVESVAESLRALGFVDIDVVDLTARVQESAAALRAMAQRRAFVLRVEREFAGGDDPIYEGHARAAIAAADGLADGSVKYAYVGARRPPP
jgi:ubiquinone/menaquinone biosynthesis C-methylase UbiE